MKHVGVCYHFVWEIIHKRRILLDQKIGIVENLVDILTKIITIIKFNHYLDLINIMRV